MAIDFQPLTATPSADTTDTTDKIDFQPLSPKTSATGAFARGAATSVVPSFGAWAGAKTGAKIGTTIGAAIPGAGETGIPELVLGFGGAIIGSLLADKAQAEVIKAAAPDAYDQLQKYQQEDVQQHPVATAAGNLAGGIPAFRFSNPVQSARGAAAMYKVATGTKWSALDKTEQQLAKNLAMQAGTGTAAGIISPLLEGQKPTVGEISQSVAQALLFGHARFEPEPITKGAQNASSEREAAGSDSNRGTPPGKVVQPQPGTIENESQRNARLRENEGAETPPEGDQTAHGQPSGSGGGGASGNVQVTPTANEILQRGYGSLEPQQVLNMPEAEYEKLTRARDASGQVSWKVTRDATQWAVEHPDADVEQLREMQKQANQRMMMAYEAGGSALDRTQWFGDAIHALQKTLVGKENIASLAERQKQAGREVAAELQRRMQQQKYRVGRSPQTYSLLENLPQNEVEKANGEQAVRIKNDKTGEEFVVMHTDLKPVMERPAGQKGKKPSVSEQLKTLGYSDLEIGAMSKEEAKALAARGEPKFTGMGAAVPSEFSGGSRDIYGIAERVRQRREAAEMTAPTQPGQGISPEASAERGRQLLASGADPEKIMSDFEQTNRFSDDDIMVVRAQGERLARITNAIEEKFGTSSPEFQAAYKTESDWGARTKAMQTIWARAGHSQQGETDIDTGSFAGLKRAYRDLNNGEDLPKEDEEHAKKLVAENQKLQEENARLMKQLNDRVETEVPKKTAGPEKPPTIENTREILKDYKGGKMTTEQVRGLWRYAKRNYIDKGNADIKDIVQKISIDLGLKFDDVAHGLGQPKSLKRITNEVWRKQTDARRVNEAAKRWVRQKSTPKLSQAIPRIARLMFGAKVFGHGGVAFGTHAPMVAFIPKYSKIYFRDFGKMYQMVFSPAEYEINVQALKADPNFTVAERNGLVNNPEKVEDFNNPEMAQYFGRLSGAGNRGYFALKILRQDMFNQGWNALPESMKTDAMAQAMATDINHLTGVTKSNLGNKASLFLFAPRLLMSRAAFLVGDPYKAIEIVSTALSPKKWAALPPEKKFIVINQIKQKATILAMAYGLLKANQYLLQAVGSNQQINLDDPTKSDFWKFKVAGMDFSYGNAMLNMMRLPVRLWTIGSHGGTGRLKKVIYPDEDMAKAVEEFGRSQVSPMMGLGLDFVFKGDYENRPLPPIPGYGNPIPMPKRLAEQGIRPYTWSEFFLEQVSPIPLEEAEREIWRTGFGMKPEQIKSLLKAAGTTAVMMGTGGRLTEDLNTTGGGKYVWTPPPQQQTTNVMGE